MTCNKTHGIRSDIPENEYIESIVEILDREMAAVQMNPRLKDASNEMDLLVADLLGYLIIED